MLKATAVIEPGEKIEDAQAAGKLAIAAVAQDQLLNGYQTDTDDDRRHHRRCRRSTRASRSSRTSSAAGVAASSSLQIPDDKIAISVNLTDPARVAGFVNPGSEVAIFLTGTDAESTASPSPGCCWTAVTVLGVGNTTPVSTTTTDETGASTTEQLPRTLLTISRRPEAGREGPVRRSQRRAGLRPAHRGQRRQPRASR